MNIKPGHLVVSREGKAVAMYALASGGQVVFNIPGELDITFHFHAPEYDPLPPVQKDIRVMGVDEILDYLKDRYMDALDSASDYND